jgi:acyl carrier protein
MAGKGVQSGCIQHKALRMKNAQNEVLESIRREFVALIDADPALIVPAARWQDFGADRFDFFGVLRAVQDRYGIEIPDDDAFEMATVGDLIAYLVAARK